jgi:ketosteroid isomerase-like protein
MNYRRIAVAVGLLVGGCTRKAPTPPPTEPIVSAQPTRTTATAQTREREVQALLDRWLAAQNAGNFDDYQALYADKFQGVRRSGTRTRSLDRAGWMTDRGRMFRKPMVVALSDVKISLGAGGAHVHFVQTWESGKYKDVGPKRLLLVEGKQDDKQGWRIAQEEMLSSTVQRTYKTGQDFLLVYGGAPVLSADVDESWGRGARTLQGVVGHQAVNEAKLPDELRRWKDEKLELFDKQGQRCTARVSGFELTAEAEWHFGTVQSWNNGEVPKSEISDEVWAQGQKLLLAKLSDEAGACKDPVFARRASDAGSPVVPFVDADAAVAGAARKAVAASFKTSPDEETPKPVVAMLPVEPARALAFVSIDPEVCSPNEGATGEFIWTVNPLSQRPNLTLRQQTDSDFRNALLAVDLDGDGEWEIIYSGWPRLKVGVLKWQGGKYESVQGVEIPFFDCPC